jgi:hypothetical protein
MHDDDLREQLADWVRPVTALAIPDIRVLRRRTRRRRIRRAATAAVATAAVAAVVVSVTAAVPDPARPAQDHPASPSVSPPPWSKAPGSWHPGAWRPAGPLPAADATPASAPYIVRLGPAPGIAQVRNMFTGQTIVSTIAPPRGQFFEGVAAAGDDRTFVLEAAVGGAAPNSPFPVNPATIAFDELRLQADGQVESLSVLGAIPAKDLNSDGFAVSQDASMLAFSLGNGFETVSLATGTGKRWRAVDAGDVNGGSLSWAGDRTLAFEWTGADNPHPPGMGLRVLNVAAAGNLLQASRLVVAYSRYCLTLGGCQAGQLLTADGSRLLLTRTTGTLETYYVNNLLVYSVRTGQRLAALAPTIRAEGAGPPCVPLWSNPSGRQVISFCGGHGEKYDHGHLSRITLHPPMYGQNFGAEFAW